jgi:hypothetical protein
MSVGEACLSGCKECVTGQGQLEPAGDAPLMVQ